VFRSRRYSFRKILLKQYVLPSFFVISISSFFVVTQGEGFVKKNRLDDGLGNSIFQPAHRDKRVCQDFRVTDQMINHTECLVNGGHRVEALLWGDSNAAHFVPMLAELSEAYGFSFRNVAHSSCPPLLNGAENFISERRMIDCLDSIEVVESAISSYDLVILSAAWGLYYSNNSEQFEG
ncbi:SGNH hydrolase domain-containing protein, partial [Nitrincola lacisaponensis]|uniref:SGNH hydrolase domain-containing protein n=1 Tax=Nitrincola lacisaponensis TaxID=267850 RepID=UPI001955359B